MKLSRGENVSEPSPQQHSMPCGNRKQPAFRTAGASLVAVLVVLCAVGTAAGNAPTNWTDCGMPNATLHFDSVVSTNPVHTGEKQFINKTLHFDKVYDNITCTYEQYWRVLGKWFRFLKLDVNACAEHPQLCGSQVVPGKEIFVETVHPPLNPLTPHGMYRSKQHYRASTGEIIGCVDMMIPYVK